MTHEIAQTAFSQCTQWRKSSYSAVEGQECVEITTELTGWVGIRDSKLGVRSPVVAVATEQWRAMLAEL
jgi:Domain of unknown function (DUF397)